MTAKPIKNRILYELSQLCDNPDLNKMMDGVDWKPNMRCRIVLEIDVNEGDIDVHGFEFRVRNPSEGKKP